VNTYILNEEHAGGKRRCAPYRSGGSNKASSNNLGSFYGYVSDMKISEVKPPPKALSSYPILPRVARSIRNIEDFFCLTTSGAGRIELVRCLLQ